MSQVTLVGLQSNCNYHTGNIVEKRCIGDKEEVVIHLHPFDSPHPLEMSVSSDNILPLPFLSLLNLAKERRISVAHTAPGSRNLMERLLSDTGWGLPHDLALRVASFFDIERVISEDVQCVSASSSRGDFTLSVVCNPFTHQWWISGSDNFENGIGEEYLEFTLSKLVDEPRRVGAVGIKIPPLPQGPLSVRRFHIEYLNEGSEWKKHRSTFYTLDRAELQSFAILPSIDASRVRVVCTMNAASEAYNHNFPRIFSCDCVGLFQVKFW